MELVRWLVGWLVRLAGRRAGRQAGNLLNGMCIKNIIYMLMLCKNFGTELL
jgi:hypothetical protein